MGILPVLKKGDSIGMESYHLIISLIEGASDLIHSVDSDGCFEFVNNAWLETLGYDESELDSLFLQDIIYPDHLDEHLRLISATLVGESNTGVELAFTTKTGDIVYVEGSLFPRREAEKIIAATGFFRDVSERKIMEMKLKESRARSDFLADLMVHDLTNINQETLSTLEVLLHDPSISGESRSLIQDCLSEVERASNLIINVRKLASLETVVPETMKLDLAEVLEKAAKSVREDFSQKELALETNVKPGQYGLIVDEYLEDVFYSLLHNSMKFDKKDKVKVEVDVEPVIDTPLLKIQIKDHGPGISDSDKKSIFDMRLHRRETILGMGLGLTLVKKILENYGGDIIVKDRVQGNHSRGANFEIVLRWESGERE
ncbi:MAG: PAS domain-containing sensor histidine kinase [Candidatus Thorarchaeota archaeon SMTZ1-83]